MLHSRFSLAARRGVVLGRGVWLARAATTHAPLALPTREDQLRRLGEGRFDLVVVGGGATGAGVALDAAARGMRVAMVERDDFGAGTSARSTKLLWAGSRYLVQALMRLFSPKLLVEPVATIRGFVSEFKMVLNCHRERTFLLQRQPHLTTWLPIAVPFDRWLIWPPPMNYPPAALGALGLFSLFFKFYDSLSGFQAPPSHIMSKARTLRKFPQLDDRVKYCVVFYEGQHDDARTNVALALTAAQHGAVALNHMSMTELLKDDTGRAVGIRAVDLAGDAGSHSKEHTILADTVMFCGGPFTDELRQLECPDDPDYRKVVTGASGIHVVLPSYFTPSHMGMLDMATTDGRFLFFLPWLNHTVVGTTDSPCEKPTMRPEATEEEINWVITEASKYIAPDVKIRREDVLSAWSGVRPLALDPHLSTDSATSEASRDHVISRNPATGTIFVSGGKWTTYREMAEDAVDRVLAETQDPDMRQRAQPCSTLDIPLVGAEGYHRQLVSNLMQAHALPRDVAQHLSKTYGGLAASVVSLARTEEDLTRHGRARPPRRLVEGFPYLEAEVRFAVRFQYARKASDLLGQRTRLAFLNVQAAESAVDRIVELMGDELGWSQQEKTEQTVQAMDFLASFAGPEPSAGDIVAANVTDEDLEETFSMLDKDKSGTVDFQELLDFARRAGLGELDGEVEAALHRHSSGSSSLTLAEFKAWWKSGEMDGLLRATLYRRYAASFRKLKGQTGVAFG